MSWRKYIVDANESRTPETFRTSDEARHQHNQEVFALESRVVKLESDNKKLREALNRIRPWIIRLTDGRLADWQEYLCWDIDLTCEEALEEGKE